MNAIHGRIHLRSVISACLIRTDFKVVLILMSMAFTLLCKPGNQKPYLKENLSMVGK